VLVGLPLVIPVITIPYLTTATETSPAPVPGSCRDGAKARGLPVTWALGKTGLKSPVPGILTGPLAVIAISRRHAE
jgi:ABC-type phosphate transport system permease subunit